MRLLVCIALASFLLLDKAVAADQLTLANCTLPETSPLHFSKDCKLLCRPAKWTDILVFYLGNFAAHAATTKLRPGASIFSSLLSILLALFFPTSGMLAGIRAIRSQAILAPTELQTALRAGALYAVKKEPKKNPRLQTGKKRPTNADRPQISDERAPDTEFKQWEVHRRDVVNITWLKVHGRISLPKGWTIEQVQPGVNFENDSPGPSGILESIKAPFRSPDFKTRRLANSYSVVKSVVAIIQTFFAIATLYRTRGSQIDQFGYAAFGLTVTPYALMSIINIIGNLLCPEYSSVFVVENVELDNLRRLIDEQGQGADFFVEGTVGRLEENHAPAGKQALEDIVPSANSKDTASRRGAEVEETSGDEIMDLEASQPKTIPESTPRPPAYVYLPKRRPSLSRVLPEIRSLAKALGMLAILVGIPLAVIGGLSGFKAQRSTLAQRVWTMMWFAFGVTIGFIPATRSSFHGIPVAGELTNLSENLGRLFLIFFYGAPAVGGYIVVGQMIAQYGTCINVR